MKKFILLFILLSLCGCSQTKNEDTANSSIVSNSQVSSSDVVVQVTPPENPLDFVRVRDYIPNIIVDLKYATKNNFTGEIIYNYDDAWLRYSTVCKLADAQEKLKEYGYQLCIWDAFRSAKSQQTLWDIYPDGNYVANPANGYSGHTRGDTVDITILTLSGDSVEMPSGFDDFSAKADRVYNDVSQTAAENSKLLENVMEECGFSGYSKEWWHYSDNEHAEAAPDFEPMQ